MVSTEENKNDALVRSEWTLGFVGCGVMAENMIEGCLESGVLNPQSIIASMPREVRRVELSQKFGIRCTPKNSDVVEQADIVVLSVKPQMLKGLLSELRGSVPKDTEILSIIAGTSIRSISLGLDHDPARIARAMPNLPCRIRKGMTVWTAPQVDDLSADRIKSVLRGFGTEARVDNEVDVDRATAISGSGPALVAHFVKAMMESAIFIGQPRALARETVLATLMGTAEMIRDAKNVHISQIVDEVTSPGGTTSRALFALRKGRMSAVVTEAVVAAYDRTGEMGSKFEDEVVTDLKNKYKY